MEATGDPQRQAAATLACLRAVLPAPDDAEGWGYALLPSMAPLAREVVLRDLSLMPKPITCVGLGIGGCLAIATWTASPHNRNAASRGERSGASPDEAKRREMLELRFPASRLLLATEGEPPVVLSLREFHRWQDEYSILGLDYWWAPVDSEPDELTRKLGATARIHLARSRVTVPGESGGRASDAPAT